MRPALLEIRDLGPFDHLVVPLDAYDLCLILGENLDEPGMTSNAAGKSWFADAIYWTMTGLVMRKEGKITDEVIRWGCDKGWSKFIMNDDGEQYVIRRMRSRTGKGLTFGIVGDKKSERSLTAKTDTLTQQAIYDWLGLDADAIGLMIYYGQGIAAQFVNRGPTERINALGFLYPQIREFKGARKIVLDRRRDMKKQLDALYVRKEEQEGALSEEDINELEKESTEKSSTVDKADGVLKSINEKLTELKATPSQKDLKARLGTIEQSLEDLTAEKERHEEAVELLPKLEDKASKYKKRLSGAKKKLTKLTDAVAEARMTDITEFSENLAVLESSIKDRQRTLESEESECYACDQPISANRRKKMKLELEEMAGKQAVLVVHRDDVLQEARELEQSLKPEVDSAERNYRGVQAECGRINAQIEVTQPLVDGYEEWKLLYDERMEQLSAQRDEVQEQVAEAKKYKDREKRIRDLEDKRVKVLKRRDGCISRVATIGRILKEYEDKQSRLDKLKEEENRLNRLIKRDSFLISAFEELCLVIIDSAIPHFEARVNFYLKEMEISKRVRFETQVEFKSKEGIEDRFEIYISPGPGMDEVTWEMYSGGEKRRISLAMFTSMNDLAHSRNERRIDFAIFDEVIENLDSAGQDRIIKLLVRQSREKDRSMWIVSHIEGVKDMFPDRLLFRKSGGITKLVKDVG